MATFLINTPGASQDGTPQDDFFIVESGANANTLFGLAGNDSLDFTNFSGGTTYANGIAGANEGSDTIDIVASAVDFVNNFFGGGQDADRIDLAFRSANKFVGNIVQGSDGDDTITMSAGTAVSLVNSTLNGNAGNDLININTAEVSGTINNFFVGGGADTDVIAIEFTSDGSDVIQSLFVNGGLGTDVINYDYSRTSQGLVINGGTFGTLESNDFSDNIFVSSDALVDSTIAGNNGDDVILAVAGSAIGTLIAGNAGDDDIQVTGVDAFINSTIAGGDGNDIMLFDSAEQFTGGGNSVIGGLGDDTVVFRSAQSFSGTTAGSNGVTFQGGAGADLFIDNSAGGSADTAKGFRGGNFSYAALSDSTFGASDTIDVGVDASGEYALIMPSNVDVFNGQLGSTNLIFTGGILEYTGNVTANPLTLGQMVAVLDANLTEGQAVGFTLETAAATGGTGFVFTKGASDDLLVTFDKLGTTAAFSAGNTTLKNVGATTVELTLG